MVNRGYDNNSVARKVTLITNPYIEPHSNLYYVRAYDVNGSQFHVCLNYMPPGVALSEIKQGQVWWIERAITTLWTLSHYVSDSGPNLMDAYKNTISSEIDTLNNEAISFNNDITTINQTIGPWNFSYTDSITNEINIINTDINNIQSTLAQTNAWSASGDGSQANTNYGSVTSSINLAINGGFTRYAVFVSALHGSTLDGAGGDIISLSFTTSGNASISGGSPTLTFGWTTSTTPRPSYSSNTILTMTGTGSFNIRPVYTCTVTNAYIQSTYLTVMGVI
jgi:hypothetical protein